MPRTVRIHGLHASMAVFEARPQDVQRAWVTEQTLSFVRPMLRALARQRRPYRVVEPEEIGRVAGSVHHEGVCIEAIERPAPRLEDLVATLRRGRDPARLVLLDGIANPHNLGAILRTCAHFGAAAVLGAPDALPALGGAARRIAQGGAERVPVIREGTVQPTLKALASVEVVSVATVVEGGEDLYAAELPPRCVFLVGGEQRGLPATVRRAATRTVTIPGTGAVESLNVSVACGLLLAEHYRRTRPR